MPRYCVAGVVFDAECDDAYTQKICSPYLYDGEALPSFSIKVTEADVEAERLVAPDMHKSLLTSCALFRKLCEKLSEGYKAILIHSSAVAVDGNAYLFLAPSGTGKSTHTALWRKLLGEKAVMVNDDKPIVRVEADGVYVYGTPWTGKHNLGQNIRVKVKGICHLKRGEVNSIKKVDTFSAVATILNQTVRYDEEAKTDELLNVIGEIIKNTESYELHCNMDVSAAELSYKTMSEGIL